MNDCSSKRPYDGFSSVAVYENPPIELSQIRPNLSQNQRKTTQKHTFGGSDFWPDSLLETDEKLPYASLSCSLELVEVVMDCEVLVMLVEDVIDDEDLVIVCERLWQAF